MSKRIKVTGALVDPRAGDAQRPLHTVSPADLLKEIRAAEREAWTAEIKTARARRRVERLKSTAFDAGIIRVWNPKA